MRGAFGLLGWASLARTAPLEEKRENSMEEWHGSGQRPDQDRDFDKGGPGDDFALGYPMTASARRKAKAAKKAALAKKEEYPAPFAVDGSAPEWEMYTGPAEPSPLDEFRNLAGLGRRVSLPSPLSLGDRRIPQPHGDGFLDD